MLYDLLWDKSKVFVCLVNCRIQGNHLCCGAAAFRGGLSGEIAVTDGKQEFLIKVPQEVKKNATYQVFSSSNDRLEIELCHPNYRSEENPPRQSLTV
jgi:hypothetical protein